MTDAATGPRRGRSRPTSAKRACWPGLDGRRRAIARCLALLVALVAVLAPPAADPARAQASAPRIREWRGDLDGILERRTFRLLVPYSRTLYFIDRGRQMGVAAAFGQAFEAWLNKRYGKGTLGIHVAFVPTPRDELLDALNRGLGDAVAANLTITPERQEKVDFARPWLTGVREIVATGPASPPLASLDDLSGQQVRVRASSSYAASLAKLNETLVAKGRAPVDVRDADGDLEDEDLLEMVAAGLLPLAIVDQHKAEAWVGVFAGLVLRTDLALGEQREVAWAIRKDSPKLKAELDAFFAAHQAGTSFGNTIRRRYFGAGKGLRQAGDSAATARFNGLLAIFAENGKEQGYDHLMLAAQGYQESQLDQSRRSRRGAVGVMQLMPSTAAAAPVSLPDIASRADVNIRAGAIYMRYLREQYVADPALDARNRLLMTLAAYNAGPGNLRKFRRIAAEKGLDPNVWFNNVEHAAASVVGRETVQYVSNIYKYYLAYRMIEEREAERAEALQSSRP